MKVRIPYVIQDPLTSERKGMRIAESVDVTEEEFILDGPISRRVAVLDFDHETGALAPGARFLPPAEGRVLGQFQLADAEDYLSRDFNQVSTFATVLKTVYMFEEADTLGRRLRWAFDGPQLLVVPRAGKWANAFYERASRSLQFFYFPSRHPERSGEKVFTSLSHDIVAHETGHAILDGIAPDLYNALAPQSLALHEAVADLTALVMAFRSHTLRETVLDQTGGSIRNTSAFSWLAEEFGRARDVAGRAGYLRSLLNKKTLDPNDDSRDELDRPNFVSRTNPHDLSQVLSGAVYRLVVQIHEDLKKRFSQEEGKSEFSVSGKALYVAAERFKRMVFRALDYLPPGEVSFADYGRAILASDLASHPDDPAERELITSEFVRRHIVPDQRQLDVGTATEHPAVRALDLETLVESDWAAYEFANRNRELLGIPEGIHFRVRPRLDVTKTYHYRTGETPVRECIFKVSWDREESNPDLGRFPDRRQVTVGTTLAIDWGTRRVRALLTSDTTTQQESDRNDMLRRLHRAGLIQLRAGGPARESANAIRVESSGDLMRIRGSGRLLHIVEV